MQYDTETTQDDREAIMDGMERGEIPDVPDIIALLNDAHTAEKLVDIIDGVARALQSRGLVMEDVTSDDSDTIDILITDMDE